MTAAVEQLLDDWLEGALDELGEGPPANIDQAGKLLRALGGVDRRIAELDNYVAGRIRELRAFQADQRAGLDARRAHLCQLLDGWALAEWERTGRKTWKLPEGEITVRPLQARAELHEAREPDDEAIDLVARLLPDAVKVERHILPGVVKKQASAGPVIDGYDAPDGYVACQPIAVDLSTDDAELVAIESVVLLLPKEGRAGQVAKAKPRVAVAL